MQHGLPIAADVCPGCRDSLKAMSEMLLATIHRELSTCPLRAGIVLNDTTVHTNDWE